MDIFEYLFMYERYLSTRSKEKGTDMIKPIYYIVFEDLRYSVVELMGTYHAYGDYL